MSNTSITGVRPLNSFLKMAIIAGVESAVRLHIERGDDLNARDGNGLTPLMLSATRNKPTICKMLLDAGADKGLCDSAGKTAHAIAIASGAHETAVVLQSVTAPIIGSENLVPSMPSPFDNLFVPLGAQIKGNQTDLIALTVIAADIAPQPAKVADVQVIEPQDTQDFDLSGWEPEENRLPPDADSSVVEAASTVQAAITEYEPIDSSVDWGDIDAYLPDRALPLASAGDAEGHERLRLLLLRAVREGSVPRMAVEALAFNEDRTANLEAEALLSMVTNDIGAEVDERFEYTSVDENFEVFVKPEATPAEEDAVADAFDFIDSLNSHCKEPLRIYQKEFQRERLISSQEEIALGRAMERGLEKALDALAAWPRGISLTLAAGYLVQTRQQPLTWISLGPAEAEPNPALVIDGESDTASAAHEQSDEQVESNNDSGFDTCQPLGDHAQDFLKALDLLATLSAGCAGQGADWRAIRETLASLRLNRRFLLELANVADGSDPASAAEYTHAMQEYQSARERMTVANLKLVFHIAKKYLYSGEPLDDLAQEGNIGLLKAVERFDWHRGFKFSTYATWWIRQQIGRYIADTCRTVRVPAYVHEKVQRLVREIQAFEAELGRAPGLGEIAARVDMPAHKVAALQRLALEPLPIHDLDIDEMIAIDAQSDFVSPDPMDIVFESERLRIIDKLLATLKPKEESIIRLRFGIGVEDALTLDEIGRRNDVTRERVRQIEATALQKLRHPSRMDAFAHAVFGGPRNTAVKEEEEGAEPEGTGQPPATKPMPMPIAAKAAPASLIVQPPLRSSRIDRLLSQAEELGIAVDDCKGPSGTIWVNITDASDSPRRQFARKLLALGFEFLPGKGYWK